MIRANQYKIPQFQRDFKWNTRQIRKLIDSMARNYPVGSLLVLSENSKLKLVCRSIKAMIEPESTDEGVQENYETYYVLDGQQRLTSIARVLLNAYSYGSYYFDLKEMHQSFEEGDVSYIKLSKKRKVRPERLQSGRLLRADVVLDQKKCDIYITEYVEDSNDIHWEDRGDAREIAASLKGIFETIRKFQVPIVVLDRDAPLDSVCRVFETINSTGTRLTTFDLAVARFFPQPDLHKLYQQSLKDHPVLKHYEVSGERFLCVLALCKAFEDQKTLEVTRSAQLSLDRNFIESKWKEVAYGLAKAFNWTSKQGATPRTLVNHGIQVAIAAFFVVHPAGVKNHSDLKRWYFSRQLSAASRQATNYRIKLNFESLVQYVLEEKSLACPSVNMTLDSLISLNRPGESKFKTIQTIMRNVALEDLYTGENLEGLADAEWHHIFPRSTKPLKLSLLDSIGNRIIVSKTTNRQLSNRLPSDYIQEMVDEAKNTGTSVDLQARLRRSFLPNNISDKDYIVQFDPSKFEDFLRKRTGMILSDIQRVLGDSFVDMDDSSHEFD